MSSKRFRVKLLLIAVSLIYAGISKADDIVSSSSSISPASLPALESQDTSTVGNNSIFFPFYPRLNLYGGIGSNSYARADGMIPLMGSMNGIVYTDIDAERSSSSSHYLSLGLGGRDATSDDFIWGGYLFADRISSNINNISNTWTVFNPGIEYMTNSWDGRLNIYYPTTQQQTVAAGLYADQVGQPDQITFSGHNQYSGLFNEEQEIGPGADMDFGYTFTHLNRFRIHAGGYYFSPQDTDKVQGGEIGVEVPINNYFTLEAIDTYDNVQNNKAEISLRVTLGGTDKSSSTPTVQDRLLDPVYHNFAGLALGTAVPVSDQIVATDQTVLERSNIWFFTANGGSTFNAADGTDNCTYEHPCNGSSFNQTNIGSIVGLSPNANFYFNPGNYTIGNFNLYNGQSIYGRNNDYTLPAYQGSQPIFIGTLNPQGNNTLDSFALLNNGSFLTGINITNANNIVMNNLQIGQQNATNIYSRGIVLTTANNITLQNSTVNSLYLGVAAQGNSSVTLNKNIFNINNSLGTSVDIMEGILTLGANPINIIANNNTFNITSSNSNIVGVFNFDQASTINLNSNTITMNQSGDDVQIDGISNAGHLIANNNIFVLTDTAAALSASPLAIAGIGNSQGGILTASGNTFTISAPNQTSGNIYGVYETSTGGQMTLNNNTFYINAKYNSTGVVNAASISKVVLSGNAFNFLSSTGTQTCSTGSYTNNGGNTFIGCSP